MKTKTKMTIYLITFILGLILFIGQVFVFSYPDGDIGLCFCIFSVLLIIFSMIRLWKLSDTFRKCFLDFLDALFSL